VSKDREASLGIKLLIDLKTVFGKQKQMRTVDILSELIGLEEAPWGDLKGKPLDARGLAYRLREYGVKPVVDRFGGNPKTERGYNASDLKEPWERYLPTDDESPPRSSADNSETSETAKQRAADTAPDVSDASDVTQSAGPKRAETGTNGAAPPWSEEL
jgi:hypothetical protein